VLVVSTLKSKLKCNKPHFYAKNALKVKKAFKRGERLSKINLIKILATEGYASMDYLMQNTH